MSPALRDVLDRLQSLELTAAEGVAVIAIVATRVQPERPTTDEMKERFGGVVCVDCG